MTSPSSTQFKDAASKHQLLLPPMSERKCLAPPAREATLSPDDLSARAVVVTTVLLEMLGRAEAVPHGGINE